LATRPYLNLGIVAHVDAGKTSLTERLLYDAGVVDAGLTAAGPHRWRGRADHTVRPLRAGQRQGTTVTPSQGT
jgi:translation elongation factor EF-G